MTNNSEWFRTIGEARKYCTQLKLTNQQYMLYKAHRGYRVEIVTPVEAQHELVAQIAKGLNT